MQFCESCSQIISKDNTRNLFSVITVSHGISYNNNRYVETNGIKENFK
ncbi:hypothetical protein NMY3_02373 [Candidatus Nitrosocosmicus oleophilus]|uniref:Uncharacterized protein n=1 Tax=Candidatus Nitrosocosmicus oleophilus TaxID=1353260 RepID=A0A654M270_9ARCH|nr:hypothetical protein NMY3_02373 [Candidatus Nitrosocosmicus oleophilus]